MKTKKKILFILLCVLLVLAIGIIAALAVMNAKDKTEQPPVIDFWSSEATEDVKIEYDEPTAAEAEPAVKRGYSVSSSNDLITQVGMSVLDHGGNAADAAIAMSYALGVIEPYSNGLGGSGGLLLYDPDTQECKFYDYRACGGSTEDYTRDYVSVPGFVRGMDAVFADYATMSFSNLLAPALYYAENGFEIYPELSRQMSSMQKVVSRYSEFCNANGSLLTTGDTLIQPTLAETLRTLQREGTEIFYTGSIAEDIVAKSSLTADDLADYEVFESTALESTYQDYTVYSANAPFSGAMLLQMLGMSEALDIADPAEDQNTYLDQLHRLSVAASGDRFRHVGDPSFFDLKQEKYLTTEYFYKMLDMEYSEDEMEEEDPETTSFSIVDKNGMVISSTNTLSGFFGNWIMVDGFFLNDSNMNFSKGKLNTYEPHKRSRTYSAPTIVVGEDGYVLSVGTPGGTIIPNVLFNVLQDVLKYGVDPQEAVDKSRVLFLSGALIVESDKDGNSWLDTATVPYNFVWRGTSYWWGSVSLAGCNADGTAFGAYDYRRGASYAGVWNPD